MSNQNPVQIHNPPRPAAAPPVESQILVEYRGQDGLWQSVSNLEDFFEAHQLGSGSYERALRITNIGSVPLDIVFVDIAESVPASGIAWSGVTTVNPFTLAAGQVSGEILNLVNTNFSFIAQVYERLVTITHAATNQPSPFTYTMTEELTPAPVA